MSGEDTAWMILTLLICVYLGYIVGESVGEGRRDRKTKMQQLIDRVQLLEAKSLQEGASHAD